MFCVIKSMRVISNKFEFKNWLLVFWTSDSKIYPNLRSRTTYQNRGIPDGGCILFYGKESIRTSCQANGCIFLFFRNFGRDFLMIIFLKWFLVCFQEKWRLFEVSFPRCHFRKCENPSERKFFGNFENYFA